mgnify:CR=1 FL=1
MLITEVPTQTPQSHVIIRCREYELPGKISTFHTHLNISWAVQILIIHKQLLKACVIDYSLG